VRVVRVCGVGGLLVALGCSGEVEEVPHGCDAARALASGEARVALHWGEPGASISIDAVAEGSACDAFMAGRIDGHAAPWGDPVADVSFLAHLDEASNLSWVQTWPSSTLQVGELAAAPEGGVWFSAQAMAPVDLGDGEVHAVGSGASVLARYTTIGGLAASLVAPEKSAQALSSSVDAHRVSLIVSGEELGLQLFDDAASPLLQLPVPPSGGFTHFFGLDAEGGVRMATWQYPYMVVERYDSAGALLWKQQQLGVLPESVAVLPSGEVVIVELHRGIEDPPPPTGVRTLGYFVQLRAATGELLWEVERDASNASVLVNRAGSMVLLGFDPVSRGVVTRIIDPSGSLGAKVPFVGDDTFLTRSSALGQRSFWTPGTIAATTEVAGEQLVLLGVQDAVLAQVGL
jgi:hypothetical protein